MNKKMAAIFTCFIIVFTGLAAISPLQDRPKNLKILPKKITTDSLYHIMDGYVAALNVNCQFCHVIENGKEDYASDRKQKKEITRNMMLMTNLVNKQYFPYRKVPEMVTCYTCHRGKTVPAVDSLKQ